MRKRRILLRIILLVPVVLLLLVAIDSLWCFIVPMSQAEANRYAERKMLQYCREEKLNPKSMRLQEVREERGRQLSFSYKSNTAPRMN